MAIREYTQNIITRWFELLDKRSINLAGRLELLIKLVKEIRHHMATQQDVDTLSQRMSDIEQSTTKLGSAVKTSGEDVAALKKEIADLNARSNVDLSPLIARAENISAGLNSLGDQLLSVAGPNAGSDPGDNPPSTPAGGSTSTSGTTESTGSTGGQPVG
nr:hypothetical protein [uncultured bacterium]